jgi:hypothetical protein
MKNAYFKKPLETCILYSFNIGWIQNNKRKWVEQRFKKEVRRKENTKGN